MIEQVAPRDWHAWLAASRVHGQPLLLDVREPAEWATASVHPDGAQMLQLPMSAVPLHVNELDPDRPVAVLCHHGGRSMQVALFLQQHGFAHVVNVAGGIDAWSSQLDASVPRY